MIKDKGVKPFTLQVIGILVITIMLLLLSNGYSAAAPCEDPPPTAMPHDCGGFTPGQSDGRTCCVRGYVHNISATLPTLSIAEGAMVTLTTASGNVVTDVTRLGMHNEHHAYYTFDLVDAGVQPGAWITITASYRGKHNSVRYQVVPEGQQVDVILPIGQEVETATIIVDDQDLVAAPEMVGFHISGPATLLTEADVGAGAEFWNGAIYSGTSTADGTGPATLVATYRPALPVTGTYELFAYAPHSLVEAHLRYRLYIDENAVAELLVDQVAGGASQGQWISIGEFTLPAGSRSYVQADNLTGHVTPVTLGFDALKWEFRTPFPALATVTMDDLEETASPDEIGFYKNDAGWNERWTVEGCDAPSLYNSTPLFWDDHIYWTYNYQHEPHNNNWAQWRPELPLDGPYDIYAFVSHCFATSRAARYRIYIADTLVNTVTVDYAPQGGVWVPLGTHELPAGASSYVRLDDVTGENRTLLAFDAMRWVARPTLRPVAVIHSVVPDPAMRGEDTVTLRGSGLATDIGNGSEIVTHEWRWAASDALIGYGRTLTLTTAALPVGYHILSFRVQDNAGRWSHPITTTLKVNAPPLNRSWHFMIYMAGDNNLSSYMNAALERLKGVSPLDTVTVTVQIDPQGRDGTWRYFIQSDGPYLDGINRWYLGELNSGATQTLADYIEWATTTYTADNVYLAIANHGLGIQGIGWDNYDDDYISLPELRAALREGTTNGQRTIDVLHLDACLMSMAEVALEVAPYASYMVSSENLGWSFFAYDRYVSALAPGSTETPRQVATRVAQIYDALASSEESPYTITALDLSKVYWLSSTVDTLAGTLIATMSHTSATVQAALEQVQRLDSQDYEEITAEDEFIDLRHFAELLAETADDPEVQAAARGVMTATAISQPGGIETICLYERHKSGHIVQTPIALDNAHGIAIYFPNGPSSWNYPAYVGNPVLRLGQTTRWDDFLRAYIGEPSSAPFDPPTPPNPLVAHQVFLPLVLRGG